VPLNIKLLQFNILWTNFIIKKPWNNISISRSSGGWFFTSSFCCFDGNNRFLSNVSVGIHEVTYHKAVIYLFSENLFLLAVYFLLFQPVYWCFIDNRTHYKSLSFYDGNFWML
jgi:hypothetical protein